jgi:hypothetical protein
METGWQELRIGRRRLDARPAAIMRAGRFNLPDFRGLSDPRFGLPENNAGFTGTLCTRRHWLSGKD